MALSKISMADINKDICMLESDAKRIRRLSFIMNTILGNACYSEKEKEAQINKGEKLGNLDDDELALLDEGWDLRTRLAKTLLTDLRVILKKYNKEFKNSKTNKGGKDKDGKQFRATKLKQYLHG